MIGVIPKECQTQAVEEFFELFKTPWELYRPGRAYDVVIATADEIPDVAAKLLLIYGADRKSIDTRCGFVVRDRQRNAILRYRDTTLPIYGDLVTFTAAGSQIQCETNRSERAGLKADDSGLTVIRLGYDLFAEVQFLLSAGQPVEQAQTPTLDIHIQMLREWILEAGIPLVEILPFPAGYSFAVCLTHDIDFVGIRRHKFDHTMWGFLYRATVGAVYNVARGRLALTRLLGSWLAAASLPFVYLGWAKDFWEPFEWYLQAEDGLPATYFLIPFKRCAGEKVPGRYSAHRATAYDIGDLPQWTSILQRRGCEIGAHGIDSWHSADKGRAERNAIAAVTGQHAAGIRMHWLLGNRNTPAVLEQAGYDYDSTWGYNETVGYRAGTGQVFRPAGVKTLLELPMHIQDGALFFRERLDLAEPEAEKVCQSLVENACKSGGVLTLLWHDRSHAPERYWGRFYTGLIRRLKSLDVWFGSAGQVVAWFRKRRQVHFEQVVDSGGTRMTLRYDGEEIQPPLRVRVYGHAGRRKDGDTAGEALTEFFDTPWNGKPLAELDPHAASHLCGAFDTAPCSLP